VKTNYVCDLQPDQTVTSFFLVQSKELRFKKTGERYLSLRLCDRSGNLDAKMWDGVEEVAGTFERDDFVKVKGFVQLFRDRLQMTIQLLRRADESEIEIDDYLPRTKKNIDEMFGEVERAAGAVSNPYLKQLLEDILADQQIVARLKIAPAAKSLHHAVIGGLLEHVVSLLRLADLTASNYDFIDLDLLRAGVILHDLGKIHELDYGRSFSYTTEGQLLGHMVIVLRILEEKCRQVPGFPPNLKTLLEHMILSHHGKYEFGSPKLPMFPEALMLSYLDDMDSKLESIRATLALEETTPGEWTTYNPSLERSLLKKDRFLAGPEQSVGNALGGAEERTRKAAVSPTLGSEAGSRAEHDPAPNPRPRTLSLFGERLQSALDRPDDQE
jgi:3'-5' exoribonuclease